MKKKITISIEQRAYEWAQKKAEEENRNLSNWIETLIARDEIDSIFYEKDPEKEDEK